MRNGTVTYTARARRDLCRIPPGAARRIIHAVTEIREDPYGHLQKLAGFSGTPVYRLRVGEYRAVLTVEGEYILILALEAGHHSSICR